jgi:hypothetical protein
MNIAFAMLQRSQHLGLELIGRGHFRIGPREFWGTGMLQVHVEHYLVPSRPGFKSKANRSARASGQQQRSNAFALGAHHIQMKKPAKRAGFP